VTPGHRTEATKQSFISSTPDENSTIQQFNSVSLVRPKWPPHGFSAEDDFSEQQARDLIALGAPWYQGFCLPIPHASEDYFALYATCEGVEEDDNSSTFYNPAFAAITFHLYGPGRASEPWDTLEQPSLAFCYGERPGTITLNYWVGLSARLRPALQLRDPGVKPRDVDFPTIIDRLIYLERGLGDESEDVLYKGLYKKFLKDPDRIFNPHKAMEKQIADLIVVLSGPQWIDFSDPRNQVVAKFFGKVSFAEEGRYKQYFHQLLLSTELDLRIQSKSHADSPKRKLLSQLPPCIAWGLTLSRKWRECMRTEKIKKDDGSEKSKCFSSWKRRNGNLTNIVAVKLHLLVKKRQVKALRKFARAMKWPNLTQVDEVLRCKDRVGKALQDGSSDAMSYFSGVTLPGGTLPFLLMNSLVDFDEENGGSHLNALSHMYPQCGFQYRSTTYWSSACIVGRVLAPNCREIAGWIGPAMSTPDLDRIQIARIRQRRPKQQISSEEVRSMSVRSDPLGPPPPHNVYPVVEYQLVLPDLDDVVDTIRIEKLSFAPVSENHIANGQFKPSSKLFDACIQFAIDGKSWPLRLSFDVSYISAYPCVGGPHALFYDYVYQVINISEILSIKDWGGSADNKGVDASMDRVQEDNDSEKVLVVKAFGVPDNEILARAWASHWGLSAIVANIQKTW
jgi:hypothetical protein